MKGRIRVGFVLLMVIVMTIPAFGVPVESGNDKNTEYEYASDRIIVKFAENATAAEKRSIKAANNLETKRKFKMGAEAMLVKGNRSVEDLAELLNKMDKVEYAELDYILEIPEYEVEDFPYDPYDDSDSYLWGMDNIDAPEAWALEQGREEVIVAVIDTGIDYNHIDLDGNMWQNEAEANGIDGIDDNNEVDIYPYIDDIYGWDFVNDDADPYDDNSHGTHVAGTIAAEANGMGVVGVAPNVKVMALKCFDADGYGSEIGFTSDVAAAIEYADEKGAKIINASWGGGGYSTTIKSAIEAFDGIFVAAAGNGVYEEELDDYIGVDNDVNLHYPSSYNCANIISVASLDDDFDNNGLYEKSYFSNYGTDSVDIFSPGGDIISTVPYDNYDNYWGTSMATPHVSGVLALMISHEINVNDLSIDSNSMRTPELLINDVMESVVYDPYYSYYVKSGGRLNAYNALLLTPGYGTEPLVENQPPVKTEIDYPEITPSIDGLVEAGMELTANPGTWTDDEGQTISYEYQWQVKMNKNRTVAIGTGQTITLDSYEGKYIKVIVTASDGELSTVAESGWYEVFPADTGTEPITDTPVVNITSPSDGDPILGSVTLSASVDASGTVAGVEFLIDEVWLGIDTDGTDGWSIVWDSTAVGDGNHVIRIEATDEYGIGSHEITVMTDNFNDISFTVSIVSPVSGARDVSTNAVIELSFSEAVDKNTVEITALSLTSRTDTIPLTEDNVSFSDDGLSGYIDALYTNKTKYTLTIETNFVNNEDNEELSEKLVSTFTTVK